MSSATLATLKAAIASADAELERATRALAPKHVGGEMEAYHVAFQNLMEAERNLARAEHRPYAIACDCSLSWDVGAPLPTLLQTDQKAFLFFWIAYDDDNVGKIVFEWCLATTFGVPGDEAFNGHPLYGSGFEPYRAMQVINSPWIERLREVDSVHPHHDPSQYELFKHFIFPFHDTTFECVARSFKASTVNRGLADAVRIAVDSLY